MKKCDRTNVWSAALILLTAAASIAAAQDAQPANPQPTNPPPAASPGASPAEPPLKFTLCPVPTWTVQVEPVAWYAGPAGNLKLPGVTGGLGGGVQRDDVELSSLNLDSSRLSPAGEIHINADRWRFSFSGAAYSSDNTTTANSAFQIGGVNVAANDTLRTSLDQTTVQLTAGYQVWSRDFAAACVKPDDAIPAVLRLYVLGGGRLLDLDVSVESLDPTRAGTAATDQFYAEVIAGVRAEVELADDFTIDLELSGGGMGDSDRSIASFDIIVGFHWRPVENVGVQIGWRQLAHWLSDGDGDDEFSFNGETAGVYAGVVIRF